MSPQGLVHRVWRPGKETEQPVGQRLIGEGRDEKEEKRPQHWNSLQALREQGHGGCGSQARVRDGPRANGA